MGYICIARLLELDYLLCSRRTVGGSAVRASSQREEGGVGGARRSVESSDSPLSSPAQLPVINDWVVVN